MSTLDPQGNTQAPNITAALRVSLVAKDSPKETTAVCKVRVRLTTVGETWSLEEVRRLVSRIEETRLASGPLRGSGQQMHAYKEASKMIAPWIVEHQFAIDWDGCDSLGAELAMETQVTQALVRGTIALVVDEPFSAVLDIPGYPGRKGVRHIRSEHDKQGRWRVVASEYLADNPTMEVLADLSEFGQPMRKGEANEAAAHELQDQVENARPPAGGGWRNVSRRRNQRHKLLGHRTRQGRLCLRQLE